MGYFISIFIGRIIGNNSVVHMAIWYGTFLRLWETKGAEGGTLVVRYIWCSGASIYAQYIFRMGLIKRMPVFLLNGWISESQWL